MKCDICGKSYRTDNVQFRIKHHNGFSAWQDVTFGDIIEFDSSSCGIEFKAVVIIDCECRYHMAPHWKSR